MNLPLHVKTWWPVVVACGVMFGVMTTGVGYYARSEARDLIRVEMKAPLKRLEDVTTYNRKTLNELRSNQRVNKGRYDEKFKGLDNKLDLILQFQRRQQR